MRFFSFARKLCVERVASFVANQRHVFHFHFLNNLHFLLAKIAVVYIGKNKKGQNQLSRRKVMEDRGVKSRDGGPPRRVENKPPTPAPEMSKEEMDVIAQAIENATSD